MSVHVEGIRYKFVRVEARSSELGALFEKGAHDPSPFAFISNFVMGEPDIVFHDEQTIRSMYEQARTWARRGRVVDFNEEQHRLALSAIDSARRSRAS